MRKLLLWVGAALAFCAACNNPGPIVVDDPILAKHPTGVFTIRVPRSWKLTQDTADTEALGIFTDPTGQVSLLTYVGLLERRLTDEEGFEIVNGLASTLLSQPADAQVTEQRRLQPDGAFEVMFTFTNQDGQKMKGRSIFHDTDLALSGVILTGPEPLWPDLQSALAPFVDSFAVDSSIVHSIYFWPVEDSYYVLVAPIDWAQRRETDHVEVQSRNRQMSIRVVQEELGVPVGAPALADQAAASLRKNFGVNAKVTSSESLPDGRLKVTLERGDRRHIGYVEQFGTRFVGLFFQVPVDRVADYQPFMDFIYSTYVTGPP